MPEAIYIASVVGAIALYLMMPRHGYNPRTIGALLGAFTLGGFWLVAARQLPEAQQLGIAASGSPYYYIFSALAIGASARVITHSKPVYAALWFVMVVLSSAGLLMILSAPFMAFAMVIVYAGAILVTYLFVIMLAAQAGGPESCGEVPEYERVAREPATAVVVGFVLLASLLSVAFERMDPNPAATTNLTTIRNVLTRRAAVRYEQKLAPDQWTALEASILKPGELRNSERIGFDLFNSHPLGLELAGVILLVALVGAVVIARQQVSDPDREDATT